jgi:hypothetical protein
MRGRPFEPGNKFGRGRPPGSRNKTTLMQQKIEEHGEALIAKCVMEALKGNIAAMRLCMDRLVSPRRERTVRFKIPLIQTLAEVSVAMEAVLAEVARGKLTPSEGQAVSAMLDCRRRMMETEQMKNSGEMLIREYVGVDISLV